MIHKISEKAIMYAILNNYIKQEQYDEYVYDMGMYFILARI